ncbi:hypothetical protein ACNFBR_28010 [Pseudomonas sp. NY11955]|uniref:DUF1281 family ferredoxin-like fold protein n=1 Tax=Pseudomonas sp. NY11955 TaxID=3400363 RepID=UPI003A85F9CB
MDVEGCSLSFDTAWNAPVPVFKALSALPPAEDITVVFADEDIGSNCGTLKLKAGDLVEQECAGSWGRYERRRADKQALPGTPTPGWEDSRGRLDKAWWPDHLQQKEV